MKARYLSIFLAFASVYSFAQKQILSEDELKEGFYIQQPAWESDCLLDSLDRYCDGTMEYQEDGKVSSFHTPKQISNYIYPSDALHIVGKFTLPPSDFVCVYEQDKKQGSSTFILYWLGVRENPESPENQMLKKFLKREYGCVEIPGDSILIPAKWYSGNLTVLEKPFVYGHHAVTRHWLTCEVKDGVCLAEEGMHPANGHFMHGGKLNQAIGAIDKAGVKKLSYDGVASNKNDFVPAELQSRKALALFAHNINDCIDTSLIPKGMNKEYAVMLYLDDNSKAHLHPLLPRELTDEDKLVLGLLSAAVHQQSDGTFQGYWSGKGYFNAIYLNATLQHNGWAFEDYKYTSKP